MSALFNFQSLLSVILLLICTCAYLRAFFPSIMDRNKTGTTNLNLLPMAITKILILCPFLPSLTIYLIIFLPSLIIPLLTGYWGPFGSVQELAKGNLLI